MAADSWVIDGSKVLIISESMSPACDYLITSLKRRQCSVAVTGMNEKCKPTQDCAYIASDIATGPGRCELASKHFEQFHWIILVSDDMSVRRPVQMTAAATIEPLSSANRDRHLSMLFETAQQPKYLVYVTALLTSTPYLKADNVAVFARAARTSKMILEVHFRESEIKIEVWDTVWSKMATGQFTSLNDDPFDLNNEDQWPGDTLTRSSSRKKEQHPWTVQDCTFFP